MKLLLIGIEFLFKEQKKLATSAKEVIRFESLALPFHGQLCAKWPTCSNNLKISRLFSFRVVRFYRH